MAATMTLTSSPSTLAVRSWPPEILKIARLSGVGDPAQLPPDHLESYLRRHNRLTILSEAGIRHAAATEQLALRVFGNKALSTLTREQLINKFQAGRITVREFDALMRYVVLPRQGYMTLPVKVSAHTMPALPASLAYSNHAEAAVVRRLADPPPQTVPPSTAAKTKWYQNKFFQTMNPFMKGEGTARRLIINKGGDTFSKIASIGAPILTGAASAGTAHVLIKRGEEKGTGLIGKLSQKCGNAWGTVRTAMVATAGYGGSLVPKLLAKI